MEQVKDRSRNFIESLLRTVKEVLETYRSSKKVFLLGFLPPVIAFVGFIAFLFIDLAYPGVLPSIIIVFWMFGGMFLNLIGYLDDEEDTEMFFNGATVALILIITATFVFAFVFGFLTLFSI